MARILVRNQAYEAFSRSPTGLAPGVSVTLHLPVSGKRVPVRRALIDTGAEICILYPRDVRISLSSDVDYDPETGEFVVGVEVAGELYYVQAGYRDYPFAGTEQMLIGMNLLSNWLVTLHGRRRLLSVAHLDPDE